MQPGGFIMAVYVIGYDLHPKKGETYDNLIKAIQDLGTWWHCLDSTWMVDSSLDAGGIRDALRPHMYKDDQLLVVKYASSGGGRWAYSGFTGDCAQWIKDHLS